MPTFKQEWESYRKHVLPPDVSTIQERETRRAFYAGAQGLLSILDRLITVGQEITDQDVDVVTALTHELDAFLEEVKNGRA